MEIKRAAQLNSKLRKKMYILQNRYLEWRFQQTPEVIQEHSYENVVRNDILLWLSLNDLESEEALALLRLPDPLTVLFHDMERLQNTHLHDDIVYVIENRANQEIAKQHKQQSEHCR